MMRHDLWTKGPPAHYSTPYFECTYFLNGSPPGEDRCSVVSLEKLLVHLKGTFPRCRDPVQIGTIPLPSPLRYFSMMYPDPTDGCQTWHR